MSSGGDITSSGVKRSLMHVPYLVVSPSSVKGNDLTTWQKPAFHLQDGGCGGPIEDTAGSCLLDGQIRHGYNVSLSQVPGHR